MKENVKIGMRKIIKEVEELRDKLCATIEMDEVDICLTIYSSIVHGLLQYQKAYPDEDIQSAMNKIVIRQNQSINNNEDELTKKNEVEQS